MDALTDRLNSNRTLNEMKLKNPLTGRMVFATLSRVEQISRDVSILDLSKEWRDARNYYMELYGIYIPYNLKEVEDLIPTHEEIYETFRVNIYNEYDHHRKYICSRRYVIEGSSLIDIEKYIERIYATYPSAFYGTTFKKNHGDTIMFNGWHSMSCD